MALLKSGSTVGGNLIWHQGILPTFPAGDSFYYKSFKIYTEKDKPTPNELNVYSKNELNRRFNVIGNTEEVIMWFKFGTLKLEQYGQTIKFDITGGIGFNGKASQNKTATIIVRTGNGSKAVNELERASIRAYDNGNMIHDVGIIETSAHVYDLYIRLQRYTINSILEVTAESINKLSAFESKWEAVSDPTLVLDHDVVKMYSTCNKPTKDDVGLSAVTNDVQVRKSGDTMTGPLTVNVNTENTLLTLMGNSTVPLMLHRKNNDFNCSIGFQVSNHTRYLGIGPNRELRWGTAVDQTQNAKVYTTEFKPTNVEVEAVYKAPTGLADSSIDNRMNPGQFFQPTTSQATASRGYPEQLAGSLVVLDNQANGWGRTQEYRPYNNHRLWLRFSTAENKWSNWAKFYSTADKPSHEELNMVTRARATTWDYFSDPRFVESATGGPVETTTFYGITVNRSADTQFGMQIAGRNNRFYFRTKENNAFQTWQRVYTTGYKPSSADVGAYSKGESDDRFVSIANTNLGRQYTPLTTVQSGQWGKPIGYSIMVNSNSPQRPPGTSLGYWHVIAARDTANGYAGLWTEYAGGRLFYGEARRNTDNPTWRKIYTDASKPTPAELNVYSKQESDSNYSPKNIFESNGNEAHMWTGDKTAYMFVNNARNSGFFDVNKGYIWGFNVDGTMKAGLIPLGHGGTGARDAGSARNNLQVYSKTETDARYALKAGATGQNFSGNIGYFADVEIRSDLRFKFNLTPILDSLSKINKLKGYSYDLKLNDNNIKRSAGIIAQDVQKVLPEIVRKDESNKLVVSYHGLIGLLVNGINELNERVKELEKRS